MTPQGRVGLTTRATCLLAAGITAVALGLILSEVDLVRAGIFAAAVPAVSLAVVRRSRLRIANQRTVEPARPAAGDPVTVHLTVSNTAALPAGTLLLEDQLPSQLRGRARFVIPGLAGKETRTVSYRIPAMGRGRYRCGPLRVRLTDPFRMVDVVRSFRTTSEFLVTPAVDPLPRLDPPRSLDVGDNAGSHSIGMYGADDASTREYRTGDDLRKVHWRSSARTGTLMVRQEERPWQGQTTVLLDLRAGAHRAGPANASDPRDCDSAEWAISAAASIGTHLLASGRALDLVDDLAERRRLRFERSVDLADHLAEIQTQGALDLAAIGPLVRSAVRDSVLVAVLGALDPTSLRMLADAHPRGASVPAFALLLDTGSWVGAGPNTAGDTSSDTDERTAATARVLASAGWRTVVVRRGDTVALAWTSLVRSRGGFLRAGT